MKPIYQTPAILDMSVETAEGRSGPGCTHGDIPIVAEVGCSSGWAKVVTDCAAGGDHLAIDCYCRTGARVSGFCRSGHGKM